MTIRITDLGQEHLKLIGSTSTAITKWKQRMGAYKLSDMYPDDGYAWLACVLALKAVDHGNFGVGCILVDGNGNVIIQGHNEVFSPYFRSDRHAEMVVIDKFEDTYQELPSPSGYTLYTSLESCPMCMSRLITSRIRKVYHVAPDMDGGMIHLRENLPEIWKSLANGQQFDQARCSPKLVEAAEEIFRINASVLNLRLKNR